MSSQPTAVLTDQLAVLAPESQSAEQHLVNRLTFGGRSSEVARVAALGLDAYIEEQLAPESIDDSAVEQAVAHAYPDLSLSSSELYRLQMSDPGRYSRHPRELQAATVYRALFSRRQLYERMVEFWSDHFTVYQRKGQCAILKTIDDRDVIRPHALGRFRDLVRASAHSTAMLLYLDNVSNTLTGPNENYARELMELHTLGVDGGYTHRDVVEVARCFTGWGMVYSDSGFGQFYFETSKHDRKEKTVLGVRIPAGGAGEADGNTVIDLVTAHPSTARFIAKKLCRRFISDDPPAAAVDAVAAAFTASDGEIKVMLRTLLHTPEFWAAQGQKLKRPFDFAVSAGRALPARISAEGARQLVDLGLRPMAQVPFWWETPDGYPDLGVRWLTTSSLLTRWNLSAALCRNLIPGVAVDWLWFLRRLDVRTIRELVDNLTARLVGGPLTASQRQALLDYAAAGDDPDEQRSLTELSARAPAPAALLLSSPYFLWR